MSFASRDLSALLNHLGITETDLAGFSEQQIDKSLDRKEIVEPAEIACVKNAWRRQRQLVGVFFNFSEFIILYFGLIFLNICFSQFLLHFLIDCLFFLQLLSPRLLLLVCDSLVVVVGLVGLFLLCHFSLIFPSQQSSSVCYLASSSFPCSVASPSSNPPGFSAVSLSLSSATTTRDPLESPRSTISSLAPSVVLGLDVVRKVDGIQVCVFDAYGTLFDVNSAALTAKTC